MGLVDSSPHYLEILQMMLNKVSGRDIEQYLWDNYQEKISYSTLNKFKSDNADIAALIRQVELQQKTIEDGKVAIVEDKIERDNQAQEMIIKEINKGINVLNFIRGGLEIADQQDLFETFFNDETIPLKEKIQVAIQLAKLDLDWLKSDDTNIDVNIDNNLNSFVDDSEVVRFINESEAKEQDSKWPIHFLPGLCSFNVQ